MDERTLSAWIKATFGRIKWYVNMFWILRKSHNECLSVLVLLLLIIYTDYTIIIRFTMFVISRINLHVSHISPLKWVGQVHTYRLAPVEGFTCSVRVPPFRQVRSEFSTESSSESSIKSTNNKSRIAFVNDNCENLLIN